jgi:uncharacterized surface protein with fasciclin (FAS1) repeats
LPIIPIQISAREDLTDLIIGLETANVGAVLGEPSKEPIVMLAPNNEAFSRLAEVLNAPVQGLLSEPAVLSTLIKYHLIPSGGTCDGQLTGEVTTAHGESLSFNGDGTVTDSNGNQVNILEVIEALNGAVVVVDSVLLPLGPYEDDWGPEDDYGIPEGDYYYVPIVEDLPEDNYYDY